VNRPGPVAPERLHTEASESAPDASKVWTGTGAATENGAVEERSTEVSGGRRVPATKEHAQEPVDS